MSPPFHYASRGPFFSLCLSGFFSCACFLFVWQVNTVKWKWRFSSVHSSCAGHWPFQTSGSGLVWLRGVTGKSLMGPLEVTGEKQKRCGLWCVRLWVGREERRGNTENWSKVQFSCLHLLTRNTHKNVGLAAEEETVLTDVTTKDFPLPKLANNLSIIYEINKCNK